MYSSVNIFKIFNNISWDKTWLFFIGVRIIIDYDYYIFCIYYIPYITNIGLDINKTINYIIEFNCSKYQFHPQDQTDDAGCSRSLRREPQVHVRDADGGVLLLLQEVHERSSKWPPFWVYHDWTRWY